MNKTTQCRLALLLAAIDLLALAALLYLVFVFPKTAAVWTDQGRHLSVAEQSIVSLSEVSKRLGILLLPLLLAVGAVCVAWADWAWHGRRRNAAGRGVGACNG